MWYRSAMIGIIAAAGEIATPVCELARNDNFLCCAFLPTWCVTDSGGTKAPPYGVEERGSYAEKSDN